MSTVDGFQFYTSNGIHSLVNYVGDNTEIVLPDSYNGENYKIANYAFHGCNSLTSVTIPEGVTSIGVHAFHDCSSLTSITIPEGVTEIGNYAFDGCTSLKKLLVEDGNTTLSLGYNNYYSSGIGQGLFYDCPLETVYLGRNLSYNSGQSYGYSPLYNNTKLISVAIGDRVTSIGVYAFHGCSSLTSITIPEGVTSIGECAFYGCSSLTSITIPEGVTEIEWRAFEDCSSLTSIIIPKSVTKIGYDAFYACGSLYRVINKSNLSLSKGSSENGYVAYYAKIVYQGIELTTIDDFQFYTSDGIHSLINYVGEDTEIVLPESYKGESYEIGDYAFYGCNSLTSITGSEKVTSIGYEAFKGTTWNNNHPDGMVYIGNILYEYKGAMPANTVIEVREGTVGISSYAFSDCSGLTAITLPKSVTSIGNDAFYNCSSLYKVFNNSNLSLSKGSSNNGYVAYYAKVIYQGGELSAVDDFQFYTSDGIHSLVNYIGEDTEIVLPDNYSGNSYRIGDYAFYNCSSNFTSVTIPEGVTSIGDYAFKGCSSLTSITIPEGVTSIGECAFYGCSSLTSITIPEGVTSIGECAFYGCSSLTSITIPEGVTSIEWYAFEDCCSLISISLPKSVTGIRYCAFKGCSSLISITIPEGVTSIGYGAFEDCCSLEKVFNNSNLSFSKGSSDNGYVAYYAKVLYQGGKLTTVDDFQFYTLEGSHSLASYIGNDTELVLPDSYNGESYKIGDYAFYNSSSIISITIPKEVISIGDFAFNGCVSLEKVVIEDSNTTLSLGYNSVGQGLFYDCPLEKIYWGRNLSYSSDSSYGYSPFYDKDELANVTIGNEVTEICQYAFDNCNNIHSLTMGSGILSIGSNAFCSPDKVIWLTNTPPAGYDNVNGSVNYVSNERYTSLGNTKVYPYLSSMFEVDGVKYVLVSPAKRTCDAIDCAYDNTNAIINVRETVSYGGIAMTMKEMMPYTFYGNNHIKEVRVSHKGDIGDYAFYECDSIQRVELSNEGNVGDQAFYNCDVLDTVVMANAGAVNSAVFYNCASLKSVTLGDKVTSLGNEMFHGCTSLQEITIHESVTFVGESCFSGCSLLSEITIPQAVTKIGDNAFAGCCSLADVIIADRTTALTLGSNDSSPLFADCPLDSIYIGGKITYSAASSNGNSPFYRNTSLRTVVITDREEQIYDNEFYGCANLQNVTIGNGVKSIGNYAFSGCSSLEEFSFGSSMDSIGAEAFSDCTNLTSITSYAAVPPTCGTQALADINKWLCTLHVPSGYASAYQEANQWMDFFYIEELPTDSTSIRLDVSSATLSKGDVLTLKAIVNIEDAIIIWSTSDKNVATVNNGEVVGIGEGTATITATVNNGSGASASCEVTVEKDTSVLLTINQYGSGTFCSKYALDFSEVKGLKAYAATGYNNITGVVTLTRVKTTQASEGLFVKGEPGSEYRIPILESSADNTLNMLVGTLKDITVNATSDNGLYANYKYTIKEGDAEPLFYQFSDGSTQVAGKAYLQIPVAWLPATESKAISLRFDDGETTDIEEIELTDNGRQATAVFDLTGRRVENPAKGTIYIVNGKKIVY